MHRSLYNENLFIILVELNETLVLFVQSSSEFADQLEGFFFVIARHEAISLLLNWVIP